MKKKERIDGFFIFVSAILLFYIALMIFLCFIPLIFNFRTATTAGRVFMIIGTVLFFLFFFSFVYTAELIWHEGKRRHNRSLLWRWRVLYFLFFLFSIYLVLRYFNETIWGTLGYSIVAIFGAIVAYGIFCMIKVRNEFFNNEKLFMIFIAITSLILLFGLVLLDSGLSCGGTLLKIAIGSYYLLFTTILIFKAITYQRPNKRHQVVLLMTYILIFMAILISFPFYVKWCGVSGKYFDIFIAVYSAVIGGGLTLVGVAWTIRKGDEDRRADRLQVEADRKEEERKKLIPYIKIVEAENEEQKLEKLSEKGRLIRLHQEQFAQHDQNLYRIRFCRTYIKNISLNTILFKGFYINGVPCTITNAEDLAYSQETTCMIFTHDYFFEALEPIKSLQLIYSDILENKYSFDCEVRVVEQHTETSPQGEIRCLTYYITRVGLPKLKKTPKGKTNE